MLEAFLAKPLRYLSTWSNQPYNGEVRNGLVSHIFAGWSLILTIKVIISYFSIPYILGVLLLLLVPFYGLFRELQDCYYVIWYWNRKNTIDLLTWEVGCLIGIGVICLI